MDQSAKPKPAPVDAEKTLKSLVQLFDCSICHSPLTKPVRTKCHHVFCSHCYKQVTRRSPAYCPLCKAKVTRREVVARDDIENMLTTVQKMIDAFNREMQEFIREKAKSLKEALSEPVAVIPTPPTSTPSPPVLKKYNEEVVQGVSEIKKADTLSKSDKLKKLMQQDYIVMTSSVVPEEPRPTRPKRHVSETALDLSTPTRTSEPVNYVYRETIKYVKPMDLTTKKKRKLEVKADANQIKNNELQLTPERTNPPHKKTRSMTPSPLRGKGRPLNLSLPVPVSTRSRSSRSTVELNKNEQSVKTNSDEMLGNLSEDTFINTNEQTGKTTRASIKKQKENSKTQANSSQESFVFKQPTLTVTQVTQSPKRKNLKKNNVLNPTTSSSGKVHEIISDFDDELRDSDLLFLKINDNEMQNSVVVSPEDESKEKDSAMNAASTEKGNAFQSVSKSRTGTPSQSSKLSRRRSNCTAAENVDKKHSRHDTNDLFGDVAWVDDAFTSSNESDRTPTTSVEIAISKNQASVNDNNFGKKRYVFCPTRLTKDQMAKLQQLCKLCNGTISNDYTSEVTHLIINLTSGRVPQTLKYLLAIAGRKWVVIYDWVEKCVSNGSVVPEETFETSNFKQCDPGVKRSRLTKKDLFKNFKFYFATDTFKNMGYTFEDVVKLMTALGAEVVSSAEDLDLPSTSELIIIGDRNANVTDYYNWFLAKEWITVTFNWVLECILEYKLVQLSAKYLCIDIDEEEINVASCALQSQYCA
ncbi:Breast cancer type 1 susceptibility protein [Orchesella cincta]|uniref:RING-type E3 ubiquitin transferase BRCA1 n=1 Tax=Orchesella cincta TaxID=48709 RepID=A0A1D2MLV4_ORCCI|nr:Breast cancer type 1 susceptibility protein [Orchesella cincta]